LHQRKARLILVKTKELPLKHKRKNFKSTKEKSFTKDKNKQLLSTKEKSYKRQIKKDFTKEELC
jgi:hypothetical protein